MLRADAAAPKLAGGSGWRLLSRKKELSHEARSLMAPWNENADGPCRLEADIELWGLVFREVIVPDGITLVLHGVARTDVIVEKGGRAVIHGTVAGCLINLGGDVEIFGTVGALADAPGISTQLRDSAVVLQC